MANITDKITDVRNAARPVSARVTVARSTAGTTLTCNTLTGWPTASKVHFVTYQIDTNSDPIGGTQLDCSGIVSGSTITQMSVLDGTDAGNSIGDVVEMLPTASWGQDLADALSVGHTRTGAHAATLPLTTPILTTPAIADFSSATHAHTSSATGGTLGTDSVPSAAIQADAVTAAKMLTGQIYRHQGSSATSLGAAGTTTYDLSATDVKVQTGSQNGNGNNSDTVITFPVAFTNTPLIIAAPYNSAGNYPTWYLVSQSNLGFTFRTGVNVATFCWIAIGI